VPGGLVAAVPLECRAAIQRRAVDPIVCLDFLMLGQQLLEPAGNQYRRPVHPEFTMEKFAPCKRLRNSLAS